MAAPLAWVLNLDADLELASTKGTRAYTPTNAVRAAMAPHVEHLRASLLGPQDLLIDETSTPRIANGRVGRAFCPTSRAIAMLIRAGAEPEPHPPDDVLREVNSRAFCARLGQTLPEAAFVLDLDTAIAMLARPPSVARSWRAKRSFGMAGRGQRIIAPFEADAIAGGDLAFLRAAIAEGGVQIEPNVELVRELGQHGVLEANGSLRLGKLVEQRCDAHGQWLATTIAQDVDVETSSAIANELARVAEALHHARYFGPFGVDGFLYRDRKSTVRLQSRSEINARYSMGFAVSGLNALVSR